MLTNLANAKSKSSARILVVLVFALSMVNSVLAASMVEKMALSGGDQLPTQMAMDIKPTDSALHGNSCHDAAMVGDMATIGHAASTDASSAQHTTDNVDCCKGKCQMCAIVSLSGIINNASQHPTFTHSTVFVLNNFALADAHSANLYRPPNLT